MSDLRKKLINIIYGDVREAGAGRYCDEADEIISLCQPQWLSVEDELPKPNQMVLVCGEWILHPVIIAGINKNDAWFDYVDRCVFVGVTHWQHLPETPEKV